MRLRFVLPVALAVAASSGCGTKSTANEPILPPSGAKEVQFKAADGVTVFGYHYTDPRQPSRKVILCFHQAGSNSWEYETIAPRFVSLGFDVLAVDQRSGGDLFGHSNRTAQSNGKEASYESAYHDLEAALEWAKHAQYKTIVACGSSYSASLAIELAADHDEVNAVMAFSPGEYMDQKGVVKEWSQKVKAPRLYAGTKKECDEIVLRLWQAAPPGASASQSLICNEKGVHGASALIKDKNPGSSETYWVSVTKFLKEISPNDAVPRYRG